MTRNPIWKAHDRQWMIDMGTYNPEEEILILLLRNYKEEIGKHSKGNFTNFFDSYFENLQVYDNWNPEKRYLVLYEDIITKPVETFKKLLDFIGESHTY